MCIRDRARAEEERKNAKMARVVSAARAGAAHKHAAHKQETARLESSVAAAER